MSTYIRITEIWVPTEDRKELRYLDGLYGPHDEFRTVSQQTRFRYDEGLPGQAWAARHPIILKEFNSLSHCCPAINRIVSIGWGLAGQDFVDPR